ncbi:MAG: DivIVA domain-containing protein [Myxococcota bacterium]
MRLTPIEIRRHQFKSRLRGYDRAEVEAFLETVVADFEEVVRENAHLQRESERLVRELELLRSREKTIQDTLTTTQSIVEQIKRTASREAESIIGEAELRAEKLLYGTRERRAELSHEVTELRHIRTRLDTDLRKTLDTYGRMVEAFRESRRPKPAKPAQANPPQSRKRRAEPDTTP